MVAASTSGCFAFVTKEEGRELKQQIDDVKTLSAKNELRAAELAKELDEQLKRLRLVVDEATKVVTRNSADVGLQVQKLQTDLAQLTGRIDDLQHAQDALTKQFQDYRAASDTKLEQLVNNSAQAKNPPMPETPDALYAEAEKRHGGAAVAGGAAAVRSVHQSLSAKIRARRARSTTSARRTTPRSATPTRSARTPRSSTTFPRATWCPTRCTRTRSRFYTLKYCGDAKV